MIHRINVFLLSVIIGFLPAYTMASLGSGPWDYDYKKAKRWAVKFESIVGKDNFTKILATHGEKEIIRNGSRVTIAASAVTEIGAQKTGAVMLKRIMYTGGGTLLGVAAVTGLLEGIGWIMEEGQRPYKYATTGKWKCEESFGSTAVIACQAALDKDNTRLGYGTTNQYYGKTEGTTEPTTLPNGFQQVKVCWSWHMRAGTCQFKLIATQTEQETNTKVAITHEQLGCLIFATCYSDPVDPSIDPTVNTGASNDEIIKNAATPDERADEDDQNNPITSDITKSLEKSKDKEEKKKGTEGTNESETKEEVDEETGEKTSSSQGKFELPAFCDYAATLCEWIDWTKEDGIPEKDTTDLEVDIPIPTKTVSVNFGSECPAPVSYPFAMGGYSTTIPLIKFEPLCATAPIVKPSIIALASIGAAFIIFGRGKSE